MKILGKTIESSQVAAWLSRGAMVVAIVVPLLITLDRFRRPFGEKFMFPHLGGSADLWLPFNGARALVMGIDPYMTPLPPELRDPFGWPSAYPPTMLILYVPLVLATGAKIELACQVFYWLNIAALGVLAFVVWRLSVLFTASLVPEARGGFLALLIPLTLSAASMFAVDRGQSEIINATLCWTAVLLFTQRRQASAMALVTVAAAIKGYAVPLGLGLCIAAPNRKLFWRGLAAGAAVSLAVTLPVAAHLKTGFTSMLSRTDLFFHAVWYNHSFKSLFVQWAPQMHVQLRLVLLSLTALCALISAVQLYKASHRSDSQATVRAAVVFASSVMALMVGMPAFSGPYNYLLVLPGLLLLGTRLDSVAASLKLSLKSVIPLGLCCIVALALALRMRLIGSQVPLAGVALVIFVGVLSALSVLQALSSRASSR